MKEEVIQFVWNHKLFNTTQLLTIDGESISILHQGFQNFISGPDFSEAQIIIGKTKWAGSVEIHLKSSDWEKHGHQNDAAYNGVILHVVLEHDKEIFMLNGEKPKTLELSGLIPLSVLDNYRKLKSNKEQIPCSDQISNVASITKRQWLDSLLVQRLERKSADVFRIYETSDKDWLQTFFVHLAGYLGQNSNKQPFQELARAVPLKVLLKHQDQVFQLEALLFGAANLITDKDDYGKKLLREYNFLKAKYALSSIVSNWKFGGIRPAAFPTKRIAFLAGIIGKLGDIKSVVADPLAIDRLLQSIECSTYWANRLVFDGKEGKPQMHLAKSLRELLMINVFAPFNYAYASSIDDLSLKESAIDILDKTPPEKNAVIKMWQKLSVQADNASDSQALLELRINYCDEKKCLFCGIGKSILSTRI
jgi:hypothetical protein